jgi:hypothetical protein
VFSDRYHAHVLRTPAEVRNALRYVLGNHASHAARRGEPLRDGFVDPFSSAVMKEPRGAQLSFLSVRPVQAARTWLLKTAARDERRGRGSAQYSSR